MQDEVDRRGLVRAVAIAHDAGVRTSPNPAVGCVIVADGEVVGEGVTAPVGGPHAEVNALAAAGRRAAGATAYVTLEPCANHGRTPPCVDALVAAGVRRVVHGVDDPDPRAGGGAAQLAAAGVVTSPALAPSDPLRAAIHDGLAGFLTAVSSARPHLTLKLAQTVEGALSVPDRRWVTSPVARRAVHRWRAVSDAVLVGSGTVLADDPRLDVRLGPRRARPRPVVLDSRLVTPPHARLLGPSAIVVTSPSASDSDRAKLAATGAEVVEVAVGSGGVDLDAAMACLVDRGVRTVLAEPGRTLADALLRAGVVDRVVLHVADAVGDVQVRPAVDLARWRVTRVGAAGADRIIEYAPEPRWS